MAPVIDTETYTVCQHRKSVLSPVIRAFGLKTYGHYRLKRFSLLHVVRCAASDYQTNICQAPMPCTEEERVKKNCMYYLIKIVQIDFFCFSDGTFFKKISDSL
jgi:hypothetical protein